MDIRFFLTKALLRKIYWVKVFARLSIFLSRVLSVCISIYLPISFHLSGFLSLFIFYLPNYLSILLPFPKLTFLPICLSIYLPIYIYLSIYMYTHTHKSLGKKSFFPPLTKPVFLGSILSHRRRHLSSPAYSYFSFFLRCSFGISRNMKADLAFDPHPKFLLDSVPN